MKEPEMALIAGFIVEVLRSRGDAAVVARVRTEVQRLTAKFGLPADM
jgi:glycine/serine hydroxymethyltransferase